MNLGDILSALGQGYLAMETGRLTGRNIAEQILREEQRQREEFELRKRVAESQIAAEQERIALAQRSQALAEAMGEVERERIRAATEAERERIVTEQKQRKWDALKSVMNLSQSGYVVSPEQLLLLSEAFDEKWLADLSLVPKVDLQEAAKIAQQFVGENLEQTLAALEHLNTIDDTVLPSPQRAAIRAFALGNVKERLQQQIMAAQKALADIERGAKTMQLALAITDFAADAAKSLWNIKDEKERRNTFSMFLKAVADSIVGVPELERMRSALLSPTFLEAVLKMPTREEEMRLNAMFEHEKMTADNMFRMQILGAQFGHDIAMEKLRHSLGMKTLLFQHSLQPLTMQAGFLKKHEDLISLREEAEKALGKAKSKSLDVSEAAATAGGYLNTLKQDLSGDQRVIKGFLDHIVPIKMVTTHGGGIDVTETRKRIETWGKTQAGGLGRMSYILLLDFAKYLPETVRATGTKLVSYDNGIMKVDVPALISLLDEIAVGKGMMSVGQIGSLLPLSGTGYGLETNAGKREAQNAFEEAVWGYLNHALRKGTEAFRNDPFVSLLYNLSGTSRNKPINSIIIGQRSFGRNLLQEVVPKTVVPKPTPKPTPKVVTPKAPPTPKVPPKQRKTVLTERKKPPAVVELERTLTGAPKSYQP